MLTNDLHFDLPADLIAQTPADQRDHSRLMVLDPPAQSIDHRQFYDICDYLNDGDVLVLNNTKVMNARLKGHKLTGARIECFLIDEVEHNVWTCLMKPTKRIREGDIIEFSGNIKAEVINKGERCTLKFLISDSITHHLEHIGEPPLPPYIKSENPHAFSKRYQTVFAQHTGSVAAPTAGLHFTEELMTKLRYKGIKIEYVTLHVGYGTFQNIQSEQLTDHDMHYESYSIDEDVAERLNDYKQQKQRIISVGTTSTRTLESATVDGYVQAGSNKSNLFIYPGYTFKFIDGMITNFHLPKSSLLALVSALAGLPFILKAYREAIQQQYRFYSFGDAMFIQRLL
ncbi:tRNA preQ1(34) S-adenosylmethionine ribosyltransferase-isomerase QueA [Candidatus Marinamargulisbacteria bacterium SCGC AG-414-C22]|nr:tRNA preQ1(34) S-adenosylmethionine ribosyltransferase-isomerase QueA [Candidatus Marinamargulisbacteria bacterium SCGC AG-414-C22]